MITAFDIFRFLVTLLCAFGLAVVGLEFGNVFYSICGLIVGGFIGSKIGLTPLHLTMRSQRKKFSGLSVDELRNNINDPQCFTPNFYLMELKSRGENVDEHLEVVLKLMEDEAHPKRIRGYAALLSGFPEIINAIKGYNPSHSADKCRQVLRKLSPIPRSFNGNKEAGEKTAIKTININLTTKQYFLDFLTVPILLIECLGWLCVLVILWNLLVFTCAAITGNEWFLFPPRVVGFSVSICMLLFLFSKFPFSSILLKMFFGQLLSKETVEFHEKHLELKRFHKSSEFYRATVNYQSINKVLSRNSCTILSRSSGSRIVRIVIPHETLSHSNILSLISTEKDEKRTQ